jgi:hypothetical protein
MLEKFKCETSRDAANEAMIASRITAAAVVTRMQQMGTHWTLTAKPVKSK